MIGGAAENDTVTSENQRRCERRSCRCGQTSSHRQQAKNGMQDGNARGQQHDTQRHTTRVTETTMETAGYDSRREEAQVHKDAIGLKDSRDEQARTGRQRDDGATRVVRDTCGITRRTPIWEMLR